jgi:glycerophosphoryl diester phosphodiesterase
MSTWSARPLVFAHRGARRRFPENTIPAFLTGIGDGANAIELDVHVTKDGVVVVQHDDDGQRMCGVATAVRDATAAEVATWDAGARFVDDTGAAFAGRKLRVPRLDEVFAAVKGVPVNIDLKSPDPRDVAAVVDVVRACGAEERVLLTSFHDDVIDAVRAQFSGRVGFGKRDAYLLRFAPLWWLRRRRPRGERIQLPVSAGLIRLDGRGFVDKMHALGIAIDYWVINDATEAQRLLALGADGVITDDARLLRLGTR